MSNKTVTVSLKASDIKQLLIKSLNTSNKDMLLDTIIDYLSDTEKGLEAIYKASLGITDVFAYKILDKVWVHKYTLSTYMVNEATMKEKGLWKDDYILCEITDINPKKTEPYQLKFTYYDKPDSEPKIYEHNRAGEDRILEKYEDDLPF